LLISYRTNRRTGGKFRLPGERKILRTCEDCGRKYFHQLGEKPTFGKCRECYLKTYPSETLPQTRTRRHTRKREEHGGVGSNTGRDITGQKNTKIFPDRFFPIGD